MGVKLFSCSLIAVSLNLIIVSAYAIDYKIANVSGSMPSSLEIGHAELEGFTGSYTGGSGYGMLKLTGDSQTALYGSIYGNYQDASHNNVIGAGIGYRNTLQVNDIIGVYVYVDRNNLRDNDFFRDPSFWVVNPGVEWLGKSWDLHVNGYLPVGNRQWEVRDGWADQFGIFQYIRKQGHSLYDKRMTEYANIGNGFDVSVGAAIPEIPRAKVYVGSYYFNQNDGPKINGIFGKLNFALTSHTALTITNTYDKEKRNTFTAGLKIIFGKKKNVDYTAADISERLLDIPQRNWTAQNYGVSIPVTKSSRVYALSDSGFDKELDNIYSFTPNNHKDKQADGTFEHPYSYSDFTQSTINQIGANTNLFFGGSGIASMGNVNILAGQVLYGRTSDFIKPATGDERVILEGSLNLSGNNLLDSIRIENADGIYQKGVNFINSGAAVYLNNVDVGNKDDARKSYGIGIYVADVNLLDISNSHIYAANSTYTPITYGLEIRNAKVNIKDSTIDSKDILTSSSMQDATSYGIFAENSSLNIFGGTINAASVSRGGISANATSYGIYANNHTQIDVNNSAINAASDAKAVDTSSSAVSNVYGIFADNHSAVVMKSGSVGVDSKTSADDTGQSNGYGVYAAHSSAVKIENGTIDVVSKGLGNSTGIGNSCGAYADNAVLSIAAEVINSTSNSNSNSMGYGVFAINSAYVAIHGDNSISGSGILVDSGGIIGNGYGIYAENAVIDVSSSIIAGKGSSNVYGIYAKTGNTINLLDTSSFFVANNLSSNGDAIGVYSGNSSNYFTNDNYKYGLYSITGGSNAHNWLPDPLPQTALNNRKALR